MIVQTPAAGILITAINVYYARLYITFHNTMPFIALFVAIAAIIGGIVYVSRPDTTPAPVTTPVPATTPTTPTTPEPVTTEAPVVREEVAAPTDPTTATAPTDTPVEPPATDAAVTNAINGTFTGTGTYLTPARGEHSVAITVTVANNIVTAISTRYDGKDSGFSNGHQERFDAAYQSQVIGKTLSNISLSRVGGASLTTNGFNDAIKAAAAAAQS